MFKSKDSYQRQLARVMYMEELCDRISKVIESENRVADRLMELQDEIKELEAYYESPEWRKDFDDERKGKFPKTLNRGILTEDRLYDLFCDVYQILGDKAIIGGADGPTAIFMARKTGHTKRLFLIIAMILSIIAVGIVLIKGKHVVSTIINK